MPENSLSQKIAAVLDDARSESGATSIGWAAFTPDGVVASGNDDTVFRMASITKQFTAAAVLGLVHQLIPAQRPLSLETTVAEYLPHADPAIAQATVADLLTMTSGLPNDDAWADRMESMSTQQFREIVAGPLFLAAPPQETFTYSNLGYSILGQAIEWAAGRPLQEVITHHVLRPAGMAQATLDYTEVPSERLATGLHRRSPAQPIPAPLTGPGAFTPMAGLCTSTQELARWGMLMLSAWEDTSAWAKVRKQLQQPRVMLHPSSVEGRAISSAYGYGLFIREEENYGRSVGHAGGYPGYGSHIQWHPNAKIGVAVAGNTTYFPAQKYALRILRAWQDSEAYTPPPIPFMGERPVTGLPVTEHARAVADQVTALIHTWDDAVAEQIFSPNMDLDWDRATRRDMLQHFAAAADTITGPYWISPVQAHWRAQTTGEEPEPSLPVLRMQLNPLGQIEILHLQEKDEGGSTHGSLSWAHKPEN